MVWLLGNTDASSLTRSLITINMYISNVMSPLKHANSQIQTRGLSPCQALVSCASQ